MASVAADLMLICRKNQQVRVSSAKVVDASRNAVVKEIIGKAMQERQEGKLAELRVPDDDSTAWEVCYAALSDSNTHLVSWIGSKQHWYACGKYTVQETLLGVLQLADKYELRAVLDICQDRIVCHVLETNKPGPFQKSKMRGRLPWEREVEVHSRCVTPSSMPSYSMPAPRFDYGAPMTGCVDFAITLHTVGLMPAYRAFVSAWAASIQEQRFEAATGNTRRHKVYLYNKRIQNINESLRNGPVCSARLELLSDILSSAAALEE